MDGFAFSSGSGVSEPSEYEVPLESLRIGSWVYDGAERAQVTGLTCDGVVETTRGGVSNVELLSPIPVTAGFLEDNGFSWMPENGSYQLSEDGWKAVVYPKTFGEGGEILSCDLWFGNPLRFCQIRLRFVHELQNAAELCGVQLRLKA